jgi:hypothetical protein
MWVAWRHPVADYLTSHEDVGRHTSRFEQA